MNERNGNRMDVHIGGVDGQYDINSHGLFKSLEDTLSPMLTVMKLLGLFHGHYRKSEVIPIAFTAHKNILWKSKFAGSRAYCLMVSSITVFFFIKCIPAFWIGFDFKPGLTAMRIIGTGISLLGALNSVILFLACYKSDHIHSFFRFYNKISTDEIATNMQLNTAHSVLQRSIKVWTGITLSIFICSQALLIFMIFSDVFMEFSHGITSPFPDHISVKVVVSIITLYTSGSIIFPVCFFNTLCYVIRHQMKTLSDRLEKLINGNANAMQSLNDIRIKHHQYTTAIQRLDVDMGKMLFVIFVSVIGICCFILYELINNNTLNTMSIAIYAFWMVFNLTVISSSSVSAALLNSEAHASLDYIYDLDLSLGTHQEIGNLNMFLSKLNGPAIGFTVMNLVTITKEFLLTLVGVFATYFFLLMQFKI